MEKDCKAVPKFVHSDIQWSRICHCSARKFRKFVDRASNLRLISVETPPELRQYSSRTLAKRFELCVHKLLKDRDEYSKKSGVTPDKLPPRSDTDTDTDTEVIPTPTPPVPEGLFAAVAIEESSEDKSAATEASMEAEFKRNWPKFWRPLCAPKAAFKAYVTARREISETELMATVVHVRPLIEAQIAARGGGPLHQATWLNAGRWEDPDEAYAIRNKAPTPINRSSGLAYLDDAITGRAM
jgi:hypothetical protein